MERWVGIVPSSKQITLVHLEYEVLDTIIVNKDITWKLLDADKPKAYINLYQQLSNYIIENKISSVVIKGSSPSKHGATMAHFETAEVRGVVIAASSQNGTHVTLKTKGNLSRNYGKRKADAYLGDDDFWDDRIDPDEIRKGSREAALLIFAVRKELKND